MAFCPYIPGFAAPLPRPLQYHVFQQSMVPMVAPQFLTIPQGQPIVGTMMVSPPMVVMPTPLPLPLSLSILPPGAPAFQSSPRGLSMRIVFYGHSSGGGAPAFCVTEAAWADSSPSRDGLLAAVASWAGHHGLAIRHPGGRIDVAKVKLYVLPRGSSGRAGGLFGMRVVPGAGLVIPGDVVKVVRLEVEERAWEAALQEIRREGHEAVVAIDMSVSASTDGDGDGDPETTTTEATTDATPAPAPAPAPAATTD